jgi:hypothetical protein
VLKVTVKNICRNAEKRPVNNRPHIANKEGKNVVFPSLWLSAEINLLISFSEFDALCQIYPEISFANKIKAG